MANNQTKDQWTLELHMVSNQLIISFTEYINRPSEIVYFVQQLIENNVSETNPRGQTYAHAG